MCSDANKDAAFSLKVMINKERNKVLFAVADSHFADILLSFLTLPLGRIAKLLESHYGDEAPTVGSLTTLYRSLNNLDTSHFWTEDAKRALLNPISSFDAECERLKLDITDSSPAQYFSCHHGLCRTQFRSVSVYYDFAFCENCAGVMTVSVSEKLPPPASSNGVFTSNKSSFVISDSLQLLPNVTGLLGIITILGIDVDEAEQIDVTFGFKEIMNLLKASLTSPNPLSDLVLNQTRQMSSVILEPNISMSETDNAEEQDRNCKKIKLDVTIQKSSGKLLYAKAKEDFVEFLFSFFNISLGGVEHLLRGETCFTAINNLYRSTAELDYEYFKAADVKSRMIEPKIPHGSIEENHILPLSEECLPPTYNHLSFSSIRFPKGQGNYLEGPRTYQVMDDLTVVPFCIGSVLSSLSEMRIPVSDVEELQLQIGLKEGLSILKASLSSTSALTDALLINQKSSKKPKTEQL